MLFPKKRSDAPVFAYKAVQMNLVLLQYVYLSKIDLELGGFETYLSQFAENTEKLMGSEFTGTNCLGKEEIQVIIFHSFTVAV